LELDSLIIYIHQKYRHAMSTTWHGHECWALVRELSGKCQGIS